MRLTDRFFAGERLHPAAVSSCRAYVRSTVSPFHHEIESHGFDIGVGSSGTIEAVAQMVHAATGEPPLLTYNGFEFTSDDVLLIVKRLVEARSVPERAKIPGLDAKRADIILAGALILEGVMESFGIERMTLSGFALREGVLLDTMQRTSGGSLHHLRDVSRRSVKHLAEACDEEPEHSARVARLALELFDATVDLHHLDESCREYLEAAAFGQRRAVHLAQPPSPALVLRHPELRAAARFHRQRDRDHRPHRATTARARPSRAIASSPACRP